ncbi:MAG TPA: acetyl-CoA carboxylase biotin carboxylase subunit [Candidatus Pullichristensenella excrementigallinarum]|uniref:Biotin carboxylase n=1 Tax=Candidatus Pullichristensenella excrementigallinarum TaxID=2840907 RepID=A0A9D1ICD0_9FIRM|nr:acetyl-CoA carboxylase biotin carboxylase subunit [Candidatus Pullichristensenella excrementigallinarum]
MFPKILIANRGEIALRVIRACKEMGISTVAVFSEADRDALHVSLADESYCVGPAQAQKSYLNMSAILSAAILSGAQAIHPGYGLLSENAEFADLCAKCRIQFIGPSAEVIRRMGDKDEARRTMKAAGVPVVPGSDVLGSAEEARAMAEKIGFPLLIKARSGGGGRGIRRVDRLEEVENAYRTASAEALGAFGDGAVYMEKLLENVKHIEVQLLSDKEGNCVCLGERECSMQRKNQKLIEESPSTAVSPELREKLYQSSVRAVLAVGYEGVGTVEYLLDREGNFYFMEMNTRLQVEHPVTEMVTGIDLVKWQIRVAAGMTLPFSQKDVKLRGHAIECRINAENPAENFRPCAGQIELLHVPGGPWVRFDTALYQGYTVPPYYDSMIGKMIVHASSREEAIRKMQAALCELVIEGVEHTGFFQADLIGEDAFLDGSYTTAYLNQQNR